MSMWWPGFFAGLSVGTAFWSVVFSTLAVRAARKVVEAMGERDR